LTHLRLNLEDIPVYGKKVRASLLVENLFSERKPVYAQNYGTEILAQFEADRTFGVDFHLDF
jgi:hypothetical protein